MFCGAALTFPNSGYGLLVVAFRKVIAVVAGGGRVSFVQVLLNSRLSPASGRLRDIRNVIVAAYIVAVLVVVVAIFRMVIYLVAGGGRVSCAQCCAIRA